MWRRFIGYGFAGWGLEVAFTSVSDSFRRMRGHTYAWMLPIYGAGGLLLERLHDRMSRRGTPRWLRALVYTGCIYSIEMSSGLALSRLLGRVPWRYERGWHVRGIIRLDYAPFWYACGMMFEPLESELRKLARPARKSWRAPAMAAALSASAAAARTGPATSGRPPDR